MPSLVKSKVSRFKKVARPVALKNGHRNGVRASGAKAVGKSGKRAYFLVGGKAEENKDMKNLLGGKGANLAEMANIGLPVPPGFTITTEVCTEFYKNGRKLPKSLD